MAVLADKFSRIKLGVFLPLFLRVAQIALLIFIGWTLIRAILLWTNPESAWKPTPQVSASVSDAAGAVNAQSFEFNTDPFGVMASTDSMTVTEVVFDPNMDVPETTLNIAVKGWIAGDLGSASLQTPDSREASYRVGEEVMEGVTLHAVTSRYVVLDVRGELERLTFDRDNKEALLSTPQSDLRVGQSVRQNISANSIRSGLNASDLLKVVRLNPKFDQGRLVGHVIQSRGDEKVLTGLGLRSGDVVTSINGKSLIQGRLDLQELALTLQNAGTVRLDIERDGRVKTVKIGQ